MKPQEQLDQQRRWVTVARRALIWVLPVLAVVALGDAVRSGVALRRPGDLVIPSLKTLEAPMEEVPSVEMAATLFHPARKEEKVAAQVAVKDAEWKLKGVLVAGTKKAFLQDAAGQQGIWVTEGERLGSSQVKSIRERSVVLEKGGSTYELRV